MPRKTILSRLRQGRAGRGLVALGGVIGLLLSLTAAPAASAAVSYSPIGSLDSVAVAMLDGSLTVSGWAADPEGGGRALKVQLLDNGVVRATVLAQQARADVGRAYPAYGPNHGYSTRLVVPVGSHQICAVALNIGRGANSTIGCRSVVVNNNPFGRIESAYQSPGGFLVSGYGIDPNSTSPILIHLWADGRQYVGATMAATPRPDLLAHYPVTGPNHGFSLFVALSPGPHAICAFGFNIGAGTTNPQLGCVSVTRTVNPSGAATSIARIGTSNSVTATGWALDPETTAPISVRISSDGVVKSTVTADQPSTTTATLWPPFGKAHGFSTTVALDGGEHTVCATAVNRGMGADRQLTCARITTSGSTLPTAPASLSVWPGSSSVTLDWSSAVSTGASITAYQIVATPGTHQLTVPGSATAAVMGNLTNGATYTFSVRAVNKFGTGSAALATTSPSNIPPQFTPAPVSTSHYLRNLTGNAVTDAAMMRSMGTTDAGYNPSGHSYLVLLQIGGQDESRHGALLSASSRFVSYAGVVSAVRAYADGYHSRQKAYAPLTLAIGTNNDVDVSASAGASWAGSVISPVSAYIGTHYAGITVAGADDIEPGFSATVSQSRAWLSGYLAATSAKYVFNGSADGCSTSSPGSRCNNGWSEADLQWLSGGAAPSRTISLPQIYNYAMPQQWKWISVTGAQVGRPRLYFGGPLTEVTACSQAGGSCGSISNVDAWRQLWGAISSISATRQYDMPHGTDLRID